MLLLWGGGRKANAQQIARFKSFESKPKSGRFVRMVSKFVFFLTFFLAVQLSSANWFSPHINHFPTTRKGDSSLFAQDELETRLFVSLR